LGARPLVDRLTEEERMDSVAFDVLTRRASLLTAGTAGLAALASPRAGSRKKKRKKKKGDVNKLCKQQVDVCNADFLPYYCGDFDPECVAGVPICCDFFATCDPAGVLQCLIALD
jgi:hypothetical protein